MSAESSALPTGAQLDLRPDDLAAFRLGRLLLLFDVATADNRSQMIDIDRLGYYEFFAGNPFLITGHTTEDERALLIAGFSRQSLSYLSSSQRFSNRRARLQSDLAQLVGMGLVTPEIASGRVAYGSSVQGTEVSRQFTSLYARTFRKSASIILSKLKRLSDSRLRQAATEWLKAEAFMMDVFE